MCFKFFWLIPFISLLIFSQYLLTHSYLLTYSLFNFSLSFSTHTFSLIHFFFHYLLFLCPFAVLIYEYFTFKNTIRNIKRKSISVLCIIFIIDSTSFGTTPHGDLFIKWLQVRCWKSARINCSSLCVETVPS